jgi:hypothetical protein
VKSKKDPGQRSANRNSEMIDKIRTFLKSGRRLTIREMSEEVGMSIISYHANVTKELGMKRVATNFVCRTKGESLPCSHWLASVRRIRRVLFKKLYNWLRNMDLRILKQRSSHRPSSPRPKKSHPVRRKTKIKMATCIMSSLPRVKYKITNIIYKFGDVSATQYAARDQKNHVLRGLTNPPRHIASSLVSA